MFSVFAFLDTTPVTVYYDSTDNVRDVSSNIAKYYGKYVRIIQVINYAKYFRINFIRNDKAYYADSRDKTLFYSIHRLNHFPINFKITKYDWRIYTKNRKENIKPQI
nr:MAG: MatK/TrnK amino terminal region [Bacteriophage sp.]